MIKKVWGKVKRLRTLRRITQCLVLGLFFLIETNKLLPSLLPANSFLRLDPLLALSTMLSKRLPLTTFAPSILLLLLALAFGRAFCGWMCPMGTILEVIPVRYRRVIPQRFRQIKYSILFLILFASLLSNLAFIVIDPITILVRTFAGVFNLIIRLDLVIFFIFILALNLLAKRFFCRYLCPLGALFGLLSKFALFKRCVSDGCVGCGFCERDCTMGTVSSSEGFASDSGECILCLSCLSSCPQGAIRFKRGMGPSLGYEYDPSRRLFLASLGASFLAVFTMRLSLPRPRILRPPGAGADFLARCVRCGKCVNICPTSGLQFSLLEGGLEGMWTPRLVPRIGFCDYSCNSCGKVCPSGAIPPLSLEEKRRRVIGTAYVDLDRCIGCFLCLKVCPVPGKAIEVVEVASLKRPRVISDRCIGCGRCEYSCPVGGEAAIRVDNAPHL